MNAQEITNLICENANRFEVLWREKGDAFYASLENDEIDIDIETAIIFSVDVPTLANEHKIKIIKLGIAYLAINGEKVSDEIIREVDCKKIINCIDPEYLDETYIIDSLDEEINDYITESENWCDSLYEKI